LVGRVALAGHEALNDATGGRVKDSHSTWISSAGSGQVASRVLAFVGDQGDRSRTAGQWLRGCLIEFGEFSGSHV
ncbi:MAG: hypothetical protein AAGA95_16140, partial [Pseudomonadota bacterium]